MSKRSFDLNSSRFLMDDSISLKLSAVKLASCWATPQDRDYYFSPYMKYTRKIILSVQCTVGSNFFFFQCKTAKSYSKIINDSSRVRTTAFSSSRFGVRVSVVPNIFRFIPNIFRNPKLVKHNTRGFPYEIFRHRETKFSTENLDIPPFLSIIFFDTVIFLKHRRVPVRNVSVL